MIFNIHLFKIYLWLFIKTNLSKVQDIIHKMQEVITTDQRGSYVFCNKMLRKTVVDFCRL